MGLGRQTDCQAELLLSWEELPRSQGHPFYDKLQELLRGAGFDRHVEKLCEPYYSAKAQGRRSLPPGRYFRMLLVGYFEGIDSERGIERRCADSLSLREFLLLSSRERVPDHSWLLRTRSRLPLELHDEVFAWVLRLLVEHGLVKGEHSVDLDTGAIVAAPVHHANRGDTKTLPETLEKAAANLAKVELAPTVDVPAELIADKGYHSRDGLKELHDSPGKPGSASRHHRPARAASCAGTATTTPAKPSMPIAAACFPASPGRPSSCAPSWSSAPSR